MVRTPYITRILDVKDKDTIIVMGIGKPKIIQLPEEVVEWVSESKVAIRILDELIGHYKFRTRLAHPGAIRSLILLLYSRAQGVAPYKIARKYGVAPEQLYRIERGLKKDGLYEFVINLLSLEEYGKP
ncbi:MAG: hypothetical protein GSR72_04850 [Desulfurococcales archaeon]|nr:hypothetical protein [Desulfurococcales archaeon]